MNHLTGMNRCCRSQMQHRERRAIVGGAAVKGDPQELVYSDSELDHVNVKCMCTKAILLYQSVGKGQIVYKESERSPLPPSCCI
mmetsp:Transcript_53023/g.133470  ORF Transcript_53023/g.133470 Transcript_53023/m.133470 type:complete len:84 (-) Transcript_53023:12-263(-)